MNRYSTENDVTMLRDAQDWEESIASGGLAERAAFAIWARTSPATLRSYLTHTMLTAELTRLDSAHEFDLDAVINQVPRLARGLCPSGSSA